MCKGSAGCAVMRDYHSIMKEWIWSATLVLAKTVCCIKCPKFAQIHPWVQKLLSFDPSFPLFLCLFLSLLLLLLILDRTDVCSPLLCVFPTQFRAKIDFSLKKREKYLLFSHRHQRHCRAYMPDCTLAGPP